MITKLPPVKVQGILWQICSGDDKRTRLVINAHKARLAEEARRPPETFDYHSKACWYTLNKEFRNLSGSKQYNAVGSVTDTTDESVAAIMEKAEPDTRWKRVGTAAQN
jgi:hypothetical protein